MQGIVSFELQNTLTLEQEYAGEVTNTITNAFFMQNYTTQYQIQTLCITDKSLKSTNRINFYGGPNTGPTKYELYASTPIDGMYLIDYIDGDTGTPAVLKYTGKFSAPATGTRTIKSIAIGNITRGFFAFVELASPIVQTTTQVLNITYRIIIDYDESEVPYGTVMSAKEFNTLFRQRIKGSGLDPVNGVKYHDYGYSAASYMSTNYCKINPFKQVAIKPWDKGIRYASQVHSMTGQGNYSTNAWENLYSLVSGVGTNNISSLGDVYGESLQIKDDDTSLVGRIVASMTLRYQPYGVLVNSSNLFQKRSKIQKVFGYGSDSTLTTHHPFLDPTNPATGTGSVVIGGEWQDSVDEFTPTSQASDHYFRTELPRRDIITITNSGPAGIATYKYTKQGYVNLSATKSLGVFGYSYSYANVPGLSSITHGTKQFQSNRCLLGSAHYSNFGVEKQTATISYDGTSVLIPTMDRLLLYSIAGSNYWFITGGFTDISQMVVFNDWVFIACRNTGLYKVNPKISLNAVKVLDGVELGIDWSECKSVVRGAGNLWALAKNCFVCYSVDTSGNLSVLNILSDTSTPALSQPGVSCTQLIQKVEYVVAKEDLESGQPADYFEFFFVYTPTSDVSNLGFWLSPTVLCVDRPLSYALNGQSYGAAFACPSGYSRNIIINSGAVWLFELYPEKVYCQFGATTAFTKIGSLLATPTAISSGYSSTNMWMKIKNPQGQRHVMFVGDSNYILNTDTMTLSILPFTMPHQMYTYVTLSSSPDDPTTGTMHTDNVLLANRSINSGHSVLLDNGVMLRIANSGISTSTSNPSQGVYVNLYTLGLDNSPHGGPHRWISRTEYGWDGSSWVKNHTGSKTATDLEQPLLEGLTVRFVNGETGTSFVSGNLYKFGLCRGLLKDNATTLTIANAQYVAKVPNRKQIVLGKIPGLINGPVGSVTMDCCHHSKDAYMEPTGVMVLPGDNNNQYAASAQRLLGDFEITMQASALDARMVKGTSCIIIGNPKNVNTSIGIQIKDSNTIRFFQQNGSTMGYMLQGPIYTATNISFVSTDIISMGRSGTSYFVKVNGVTQQTIEDTRGSNFKPSILPLTYVTNGNPYYVDASGINGKQEVFYNVFTADCAQNILFTFPFYDTATNLDTIPNTAFPPVTITSNNSTSFLDLPKQYTCDPKCSMISPEHKIRGYMDGVEVPVRINGTMPNPGEISLSIKGLYAVFNPADAGKVAEIDCLLLYNP